MVPNKCAVVERRLGSTELAFRDNQDLVMKAEGSRPIVVEKNLIIALPEEINLLLKSIPVSQ